MLKREPHRWPAFPMVTDNRLHVTDVPGLALSFGMGVMPTWLKAGDSQPDLRELEDPNQMCPALTWT